MNLYKDAIDIFKKDPTCRRCGYPIRQGTRHEPFAATWMDREEKKFRAWACDVFAGDLLQGSNFGKRYDPKRYANREKSEQ